MRFHLSFLVLLSCLVLGSCRSGSGPEEVLKIAPSNEVTNAVQAVPVPARDVGAMAGAIPGAVPENQQASQPEDPHALAWAGGAVPQSGALQAVAFPQARPLAKAQRLPQAEQVAMLAPDPEPLKRAARGERSRIYAHRFGDAKPINFGKATPRHHAVHGVDVSRWQGDIDWPMLRSQGANFAFIKATDGGDHLDPMFRTNWRKAKEAGVKRGAYHFFYWCRTAGEQAEWFIRNVPRDPDALPPVIDVEYNGESSCKRRHSPAKVREKMQVFMDMLERHYGLRPIIYTAPDFYKDNLQGAFPNHPFWLRAVAAHPSQVYPGRKWMFWQYSGSGLSKGVGNKIDLNVFHGSVEDWHRWTTPRAS